MAELTLASVGFAAQLFVSVLDTYRFVSTAQNFAKDVPVTFWKLRIEQIRFQVWGRFWGIEKGNFDKTLDDAGIREDVCGILQQVQHLIEDTDRLVLKYGLEVNTSDDTTAVETKKPTTMKLKFKYAFKDKAKFESLIDDLKAFNEGLFSLLRLSEYQAISLIAHSTTLRSVEYSANLEDLRLASATEPAGPREPTRRYLPLYRDLYLGATSKLLVVQQDRTDAVPSGITPGVAHESLKKPLSSISDYPRDCPSSDRVIAKLSGGESLSVILIEWKPFDRDNPQIRLVSTRVNNLARVLAASSPKPTDLRVLDCLGYVEDDEHREPRFGYLFRLPEDARHSPPQSLFSLLARGPDALLPDLGDRFELARALAASVIRFHDCGWVHGELDSFNIVFFQHTRPQAPPTAAPPTKDSATSPDATSFAPLPPPHPASPCHLTITRPYLLGFTYARPSDPSEITVEWTSNPSPTSSNPRSLYRHPTLQVPHHSPVPHRTAGSTSTTSAPPSRSTLLRRQRYDLFSLGLVLLEIGLWERLEALWKPKYAAEPGAFVEKLLRAYVPRLRHRVGAVYCGVVERLLRIGRVEGGADDGGGEGGGEEVEWAEVVAGLVACRA